MTVLSTPAPRRAAAGYPTPGIGRSRLLWIVLAVSVVGALVRLLILVRGGGLLGSDGYDDGVYYAAADSFVHGRMPYHDFLLLQPPGIVYALAPFAWLGSVLGDPVGVGAARLAFIALGGVNCGLVAVLLRRWGWTAAAVGGGFAAVFSPLATSDRSTLLEPLATFFVLVALVVLGRSRGTTATSAFIAGAAVGAAMDTRIWYVVTAVVLVALVRRGRLAFLGGTAVALAVGYGPVLIADASATVREVVLDQFGRPRVKVSILQRIDAITGAPTLGAHSSAVSLTDVLGLGLLVVVAAAAVLAWRAGARGWVLLLVADLLVLAASPSWFPRYAALSAPLIALVLGVAAAVVLAGLRRRGRILGSVAVLGSAIALSWQGDSVTYGVPEPLTLTSAVAQTAGCVTSDDPATLAALNVLSRDLAAGCTVWPDVTGYTYDSDALRVGGHRVTRRSNPRWQAHIVGYLQNSAAFLQVRQDVNLSAASKATLNARPVLAQEGHWILRAGTRP